MLDILGREVNRGDIIVYGNSKTLGFVKYTESRLGIVNNIIHRKTHVRNSHIWRKLLKSSLVNDPKGIYLPDTIDTFDKVAFYPLFNGDKQLNLAPVRKNGKPKRNVILTNSFIILDKTNLSEDWLEAYNEVCKAFKI